MKNSILLIISEIGKKCTKIREKTKKSFLSSWAWIKPVLQKNRDILLFILALAVLTAALFRPGNRIPLAPVPSIVFAQWWEDDLEKDTLKELAKEFENLHEGINVIIKTVPYEVLRQELYNPEQGTCTGAASAKTPREENKSGEKEMPSDVIALDPLWVPELIKRQAIDNPQDTDPAPPLLSFIDVFYYNIQILKEANFSRPPKTRSEFLRYAKAITKKEEDRWALTTGRNSSRGIYDDIFPWIWAAGAQLFKDGKPAVASRPVVDSLSFLAMLNKEGLIVPDAFSATDNNTETKIEDFIAGKAAFMIAPANYIKLIRERMGDDNFGVSSVPSPDNYAGKPFYGTLGWTVGINSSSGHKEEARLFADFLNSKASFLSGKARAISGNSAPYPGPDPFYSKVWDIAIAGESTRDFTDNGFGQAGREIFREELINLFAGVSAPEEAARMIQERWEEAGE